MDRVPILARFAPTHVGNDAGFIPVSTVFDLKRLSKDIGTPVLEWDMLKNYTRENQEDLGCWGTHPTLFNGNTLRTTTELRLGLGRRRSVLTCFFFIGLNFSPFFFRHLVYTGSDVGSP